MQRLGANWRPDSPRSQVHWAWPSYSDNAVAKQDHRHAAPLIGHYPPMPYLSVRCVLQHRLPPNENVRLSDSSVGAHPVQLCVACSASRAPFEYPTPYQPPLARGQQPGSTAGAPTCPSRAQPAKTPGPRSAPPTSGRKPACRDLRTERAATFLGHVPSHWIRSARSHYRLPASLHRTRPHTARRLPALSREPSLFLRRRRNP